MYPLTALTFLALTYPVFSTAVPSPDFGELLRRQEPGSAKFACHSNCGSAISLSKKPGFSCEDDTFTTPYKACIACAGPDGEDIWKHYGSTLTSAVEGCDLPTEPSSGDSEEKPAETTAAETPAVTTEAAAEAESSTVETPSPSAPSATVAEPTGNATNVTTSPLPTTDLSSGASRSLLTLLPAAVVVAAGSFLL